MDVADRATQGTDQQGATSAPGGPGRRRWWLVVPGALLALLGFGAAGALGPDNIVTLPERTVDSGGSGSVVSATRLMAYDNMLMRVSARDPQGRRVVVGLAHPVDVDDLVKGREHGRVTAITATGGLETTVRRRVGRDERVYIPEQLDIWTAKSAGEGTQSVTTELSGEPVSFAVLAYPGVNPAIRIGVGVPGAFPVALAAGGAGLLVAGTGLLRRRGGRGSTRAAVAASALTVAGCAFPTAQTQQDLSRIPLQDKQAHTLMADLQQREGVAALAAWQEQDASHLKAVHGGGRLLMDYYDVLSRKGDSESERAEYQPRAFTRALEGQVAPSRPAYPLDALLVATPSYLSAEDKKKYVQVLHVNRARAAQPWLIWSGLGVERKHKATILSARAEEALSGPAQSRLAAVEKEISSVISTGKRSSILGVDDFDGVRDFIDQETAQGFIKRVTMEAEPIALEAGGKARVCPVAVPAKGGTLAMCEIAGTMTLESDNGTSIYLPEEGSRVYGAGYRGFLDEYVTVTVLVLIPDSGKGTVLGEGSAWVAPPAKAR
ncbi:MAG: hypothetical protein LWW86_15960 [Micrococcales bacterium]|nr:hypothetical protein [Micrococcales bacterium]